MSQLNSFDSYDDPMVVFVVKPMIEEGGEVYILTNKILEDLFRINKNKY